MVSRLYRLDYVNEDFVSTLMGEYATHQDAQAAQDDFRKTHRASWMISNSEVEVRKDGSVVKLAALEEVVTDAGNNAYTKHLEARHAELFAVLAQLNSGIKHGTITSLSQVRDIVSPLFPENRRAGAPQNPTTLICLGKTEA